MLQAFTLRFFPRLAQWLGAPALLQIHLLFRRLGLASPLAPACRRAR